MGQLGRPCSLGRCYGGRNRLLGGLMKPRQNPPCAKNIEIPVAVVLPLYFHAQLMRLSREQSCFVVVGLGWRHRRAGKGSRSANRNEATSAECLAKPTEVAKYCSIDKDVPRRHVAKQIWMMLLFSREKTNFVDTGRCCMRYCHLKQG
jgi:hypothetical protein